MSNRTTLVRLAVLAAVTSTSLAGAQDKPASVWVEGESAVQSKVEPHPWWYDKVKTGELSGGKWLSHFGKDAGEGQASYKVQAPSAGTYRFLLRANPTRSGLHYRFDGGDWKKVELNTATDVLNVADDDAADLRFVGWVDLGQIELKKGSHTIDFRIQGEVDNHGAIDAFVLTTDASFEPKGTRKPGEAEQVVATVAPEGMWAFEPSRDSFSPDALLDLRSMNEKLAGEHGFIKLSTDGESFVRGDGKPIRFWAVTSYAFRKGEKATAEHARFLAKRGVNMVRWHGNLAPVNNASSQMSDVNEEALNELFLNVAAMKKEGIYLTVSPYYPHSNHVKENGQIKFKNWGITEGSEADNPTGLLFFHPKVQQAYKTWVKEMMTRKNPHTGLALKDDPSIAIFQIQNEDSLLFWTFNSIGGEDLDILRSQFGKWAAGKHGSLPKARAAWDNASAEGSKVEDDWDKGLLSFPNIWHLTQKQDPASGAGKRYADTSQFLTETMRNWNEEIGRFLRQEIGAKQIINAGNWRTADEGTMGDLERYSYTANEVIGINRYVGSVHEGPNNGWAVAKGDKFTDESVLFNPAKLATNLRQPAGHPYIIPESLWVPPMGYQSEGSFLVSVMQSLGGVDAFYWFAFGETQWTPPASANGYLPSVGKWIAATPEVLGNFPAAALLFRNGYVEEAEPVVVEHRTAAELWSRKTPLLTEEEKFDPNRDAQDRTGRSGSGTLSPLTYLVGAVKVVFGKEGKDKVADLKKYIDPSSNTVTSATGEVKWNYAVGFATVNAPKAQGATGFLARQGPLQLGDTTISSKNDYATIFVVSMDDQPIKSSGKILVQAGTVARPKGWSVSDATWATKDGEVRGYQIDEHGEAPWMVIRNDAIITINNPAITKATILDMNGMPRGQTDLNRTGDGVSFTMPADAKYVVLQ